MPVHPTAIVDPSAQIDPTAEIGPYAIVEARVRIGAHCRIMAHAVICEGVEMGEGNIVHYGAVLGNAPQHTAYKGAPGRTIIGDRNIFRESFTVHRPYLDGGETRIGNECFFMATSHVGHDSVLGNRVVLVNGSMVGGHCVVEDDVFFGGLSGSHQFCRVGTRAMIGACSKVTSDLPPFMMADGPSTVVGLNVVGLRRAGFSPEARRAIKSAFNSLYRKGYSIPHAVDEIRSAGMTAETQRIVDFVTSSKRGICSYSRRGERLGKDESSE